MAQLATTGNVQVKDNAPAAMKDAVKDQAKHRKDNTALATYKGGTLTVADFLGWLETFPPQQQMAQRIPQAPDSMLKPFVKQLAVQELLLRRADSAKIDVSPTERAQMYTQIGELVTNVWTGAGHRSQDARRQREEHRREGAPRRVARRCIPRSHDGGTGSADVDADAAQEDARRQVRVVGQLGGSRSRLERAQKTRASADSARTANQPKSAIPMPGGATPPGAPPAGAQPPASQPPVTPPAKPAPKKP